MSKPATCVADAKISREQLEQVMDMLDKNKDGKVTAVEFKIPWMKLFPKLKDDDFEEAWKLIDANGDGNLSMDELAAYYGYDLNKGNAEQAEMSDEKILEALAMQAALVEMEEEAAKRKAEKEEAEARDKKGSSGRRGTGGASSGANREKHRSSSGVINIKMPAKVTEAIEDKNILFVQSCELGDTKVLLKMLEEDKAFSARVEDDKGEMPLHKLSRYSNAKEVIREIIDRSSKTETAKTDLNWQDKQGKTAIFYAVEYGQTALVHIFLDRGADVMVENNNGWTVLHTAVNADQLECCQAILDHPRVVPQKQRLLDACDKSKRQALHIASFKSREGEVVELLLKHGADASAQDATGNTGAKLAAKTGRRKSKELLEEHLNAANEASARPVEVKA